MRKMVNITERTRGLVKFIIVDEPVPECVTKTVLDVLDHAALHRRTMDRNPVKAPGKLFAISDMEAYVKAGLRISGRLSK